MLSGSATEKRARGFPCLRPSKLRTITQSFACPGLTLLSAFGAFCGKHAAQRFVFLHTSLRVCLDWTALRFLQVVDSAGNIIIGGQCFEMFEFAGLQIGFDLFPNAEGFVIRNGSFKLHTLQIVRRSPALQTSQGSSEIPRLLRSL